MLFPYRRKSENRHTQDVLLLSRPRKIPTTTGRYHTLRLPIGCRNRARVRRPTGSSMVLRLLQYTLCLVSALPSVCMAFSAPVAVRRLHGLRHAFNSGAIAMNASPDDEPARVRILALHGKGNTGPSFQRALEPLIAALNDRVSSEVQFDWDFPTAPYALGDDDESAGRAWWELPRGERSFTATRYIGYSKSASLIENKICSGDGFDLVIGHSQGAILLAALLATNRIDTVSQKPIAFIFNGCALPNPFKEELVNIQLSPEVRNESSSKALFVIGSNDQINPPDGAELVRDCLHKGGMIRVKTISHPNGHAVPVRDQKALNGIVDWIIDTVVSKRAEVEEKKA